MEASGAFACLSVLAAFVAAACCSMVAAERLARARVSEVVQGQSGGSKGFARKLIRNGVRVFIPLSSAMLSIAPVRKVFTQVKKLLYSHGLQTTEEAVCSLWMLGMLMLVGIGSLFGKSIFFGIAASLAVMVVAHMVVGYTIDKRDQLLSDQVPDMIQAMGACFHAGLSVQQTFRQMGSLIEEPIGPLFLQSANEIESGATIPQAIASLKGSSAVPEISFVAVALEVQHTTGGSMQKILDAARDSIEGSIQLRRSLKVQTAQANLSAKVVTAMPFVLVTILSLLTDNFLGPFFSSAAGIALLALALGMQAAGIFAVRRMLKVEV